MNDIADLAARRWERETDPAKHPATEALRAALRMIESGDFAAEHVIVVMGRTTDRGSAEEFCQSGSYSAHAIVGLLEAAKLCMAKH